IEIMEFLKEHLFEVSLYLPPESIHVIDIESLQKPNITFWSIWDKSRIVGCGALKELNPKHAEIKSMRIALTHRKKGVASRLLKYIIDEARKRNYSQLSVETGSMDAFLPARRLYMKHGFQYFEPFGEYIEDPNSVFMTIYL
ncbi:MAG: GNAT family N-acetyltransferase, partial [Syntrophaceae bacterium]|nr:GNAT family N-acetyltransferase [Syntrophaceae bacterium]